jgi:hypothetical protein
MVDRILKQITFRASNILCLTACLFVAGCGKKNISPPPVNVAQMDRIEIKISMSGKRDVYRYRINGQIEYGNMSIKCSNVDSSGGHVGYPHGYVGIEPANDALVIYRDHYQPRGECSWRLLGLGIYIYDENGRITVGGLPASRLKTGYKVKLHCNFSDKWSGNCLPGNAGPVRTDLTVDVSIH